MTGPPLSGFLERPAPSIQLKNDELISPRPGLIFSFPDRIHPTNLPTIRQLVNAELEIRQPGFFPAFLPGSWASDRRLEFYE